MVIKPHGGSLINRVMSAEQEDKYSKEFSGMPQLQIDGDMVEEVQNIAKGVLSPLTGFMCENDVLSIIKNDRLENGLAWTMPIVLDISEEEASKFSIGDEVALVDSESQLVGILSTKEVYTYPKKEVAEACFGTLDENHPGVSAVLNSKDKLVGGDILFMDKPITQFKDYTLYPAETRKVFEEKGWKTVCGFQTRNIPHLGHEYVQKAALTITDGLFINPIIGKKKSGDFLDPVILGTYDELIKHYYKKEHVHMSILRTKMRYGGPKEAIFHAIMRKNFGCTHFIVGRDHAGVGKYYGPFEAHAIFDKFPELGITPICFQSFYICTKCNGVVNNKICPHEGTKYMKFIAGKKVRALIGEKNLEELSTIVRPEVGKYLVDQEGKLFVE